MNKVILMGRLTRDPDVRYSQGEKPLAVAKYILAVGRKQSAKKSNSEVQAADFISCTAFGKIAEVTEKHLFQGSKVLVTGRIQTGSYTNREGQKVYTTEVIVEEQEFIESKKSAEQESNLVGDGFMSIDSSGEDLPFH